jgi:RimJ/RimL family protein N-acetyltransferase
MTLEDVCADIQGRDANEFSQLLVVRLKRTGEAIGQCKMCLPDEHGISETDVKLLPTYWGHRFGVEIKRGLVEYLSPTRTALLWMFLNVSRLRSRWEAGE